MIDHTTQDAPIDALIWQHIAESDCPEDFRNYLRHAPEGKRHQEEATDRLMELDDADATCDDAGRHGYPAAVAAIRSLAEQGNPVAQFHMGKILDRGIGIARDGRASIGWYRAAVLQGEPRSHINLCHILREEGGDANRREADALIEKAAAMGEPAAFAEQLRLARSMPDPVQRNVACAKVFESFHGAWRAGHAFSGHYIGYMLLEGEAVRRDERLGMEWIEKAANAGSTTSIFKLASYLFNQLGGKSDAVAAATWLRKGAELGDRECQAGLGWHLLQGEGVAKDGAEAVYWFRRAAVRGDVVAQRFLGITYLAGIGVVRNARFGLKWLTRAAEGGDVIAAYKLGQHYYELDEPDGNQVMRWMGMAAEGGSSNAQCALAIHYAQGHIVPRDFHAARKWAQLATLQGDPAGEYLIGQMYFNGHGTEADYQRAVRHFRTAAEGGHGGAQAKLGMCYLKGEGIDRDIPEGVLWLTRAVESGNAEASVTLGYVLLDGVGVEANAGEASKWFLDAAEKGDAQGQYELGMLYANGNGLKRDMDEARKWIAKAATKGHEDAVAWQKANSAEMILETAS